MEFIRTFLVRREQKPQKRIYDKEPDSLVLDGELIFDFRNEQSLKSGLYWYSQNLRDDRFLERLKESPEDLEKAVTFIRQQRKFWFEQPQTTLKK